jgi:hypothetical protein
MGRVLTLGGSNPSRAATQINLKYPNNNNKIKEKVQEGETQ